MIHNQYGKSYIFCYVLNYFVSNYFDIIIAIIIIIFISEVREIEKENIRKWIQEVAERNR